MHIAHINNNEGVRPESRQNKPLITHKPLIMTGRAARGAGRGGRGRGGRNRGRGSNYVSASSSQKKGMCAALGSNVFDYGKKDQQIS